MNCESQILVGLTTPKVTQEKTSCSSAAGLPQLYLGLDLDHTMVSQALSKIVHYLEICIIPCLDL